MSNNPEISNFQDKSKFFYHLEQAVQSIIDEALPNRFSKDKDLARSHLKRHIRLIVLTRLDEIVNQLLP